MAGKVTWLDENSRIPKIAPRATSLAYLSVIVDAAVVLVATSHALVCLNSG